MEHLYATQQPSGTQTMAYQTVPLHQYVPVNTSVQAVPVQYPTQYPTQYPIKSTTSAIANQAAAAGMFGMIVVTTGTLGANLNRVGNGEMTMGQAVTDSLAKGAIGGVAAASATAASSALTNGGVAGLAVTIAAATGVSYLINKI